MNLGRMYADLEVKTSGFKKAEAQMKSFTRTARVRADIYRNRVAKRIVAHTAMMSDSVKNRFGQMGNSIKNFTKKTGGQLKIWRGQMTDWAYAASKAGNAAGIAGKKFQNLARAMAVSGEQLMRFGFYTSMYITLPLVGAGAAALMLQKRFGFVAQQMETFMGISERKMSSWSKQIGEIAKETGQYSYALLMSLKQIVATTDDTATAMSVLRESAKAATAAGVKRMQTLTQAIASAKDAYQGMGITVEGVAQVIAQMAGQGMQPWSIGRAFGEIARNAAEAGVKFHELAGALSVAEDTGMGVFWVAQQLNSLFVDLRKVNEDYIGTVNELRSTLRNAGLVPFLEKLDSLDDVTKQAIVSSNTLNAINSLQRIGWNKLRDQIAEFKPEVGKLDKLFNEMSDTLQVRLNKTLAIVTTSFRRLGRKAIEPLIYFLEIVSDKVIWLADYFDSLTQKQVQNYMHWAKWLAIMGPIAMAIGLVISALGHLLTLGQWAVKIGLKLTSYWGIMLTGAVALAAGITHLIDRARGLNSVFDETQKQASNTANEIEKLNVSLRITNKELGKRTSTIEQQMKNLDSMSQKRMRSLKNRVQSQLSTERQYTAQLRAEMQKRFEQDELIQKRREKLKKTVSEAQKVFWQNQIKKRKEAIAEIIRNEFEANQKRINLLKSFIIAINKVYEGIDGGGVIGVDKEELSIMEKLAQRLEEIKLEAKYLGDEYSIIQEKASAYRSAIVGLITEMVKADKITSEQRKNLALLSSEYLLLKSRIEDIKNIQQAVKDIPKMEMPEISPIGFGGTEALQRQLAIAKQKEEMLGDTFDVNAAKLQAYRQAYNKLVAIKVSDMKLTDYQIEQMGYLAERIKQVTNEISKSKEEAVELGKIVRRHLVGAFEQVGKGIGDMLSDTSDSFNILALIGKTMGSFLQQMGAAIIAYGVAMDSFKKAFENPAAAIVAGIALVAIGTAIKNFAAEGVESIKEPASMAGGGVVPGGYPNDSYPAMLTSGEAVIPPGELDEAKLGPQEVIVHSIIKGEDIYLTNENYKRKKINTL